MQTADNWGIDSSVCSVPGYGPPRLFTQGINNLPAPTAYPITYDQKNACGGVVFRTDLVDSRNLVSLQQQGCCQSGGK